MFWGLIMEPQRRYSQTVTKSFHVSMASLDLTSGNSDCVQVMCGHEGRKYLLCTLNSTNVLQCPLDLNFQIGEDVSFIANGGGHVHLTGHLIDDEDGWMDADGLSDEEEEDEETEEIMVTTSQKKRTRNAAPKSERPAKKSKTLELLKDIPSQDEDDSDDSDVNLTDLIENEDDSMLDGDLLDDDEDDEDEDEDDENNEEEEDDDDDDNIEAEDDSDDGEEEEDEEEEDDDEDEEETEDEKLQEKQAPKTNGIAKHDKNEKNKSPPKMNNAKQPQQTPADKKKPEALKKLEGGVQIDDLKVGNGPIASQGKMVCVYYEGRLKNNNKMFDACNKGKGFQFRLGKNEVIKGWEVGIKGMRLGGKRKIICPPNMAYGAKGSPPAIPPNSTLVFDVELKQVK